jgi:hypothetical protein
MTTLIFCGGVQNVVVENVSANQSILDFLLIVGHIKFPMVQKALNIIIVTQLPIQQLKATSRSRPSQNCLQVSQCFSEGIALWKFYSSRNRCHTIGQCFIFYQMMSLEE